MPPEHRFRAALRPPPRLRLSEWLEAHVCLPEGTTALPGRLRLWPYQREIADGITDPTIERLTVVKPVRVGFTTLLTGAVASFVANDPAPILCLLPTESDCRDYAQSDQRVYEIPCPRCGAFTELLWSMIEWETGKPETAAFRCPSCQALVPETEKPGMVAAGRWRPLQPSVKGHAGFRLNALVS